MYKQTGIDTFSIQLVCSDNSRACIAARMTEAELTEKWEEMKADRYTSAGNYEKWVGGVVVDTWG